MSETERTASGTYVSSTGYDEPERTGWVGWVLYAGVMMMLLGIFAIIEGFVAIFDDDYFKVANSDLVVHVNYNTFGVVHICLGALAIAGGLAVMAGKMWARVFAVGLAMINAVVNLAFLSAYPVWSVMMITIDALV